MKRYQVDAAKWSNLKEMHEDLKKTLHFPEYYGCNLDALHDVLTECRDTELTVLHPSSMFISFGERGNTVLQVLADCAQENEGFSVRFRF